MDGNLGFCRPSIYSAYIVEWDPSSYLANMVGHVRLTGFKWLHHLYPGTCLPVNSEENSFLTSWGKRCFWKISPWCDVSFANQLFTVNRTSVLTLDYLVSILYRHSPFSWNIYFLFPCLRQNNIQGLCVFFGKPIYLHGCLSILDCAKIPISLWKWIYIMAKKLLICTYLCSFSYFLNPIPVNQCSVCALG